MPGFKIPGSWLCAALFCGFLTPAISQTFSYTGSPQTYTVPSCVSAVQVDARGGKGGSGDTTLCQGGRGGRVVAEVEVVPGEVWSIYVGGAGTSAAGGYNGGGNPGPGAGAGGAGATDIRKGGTSLYHRILVAAGGGGAGSIHNPNSHGGNGGGLVGNNGLSEGSYAAANCGGGGTQMAGGAGATTNSGQAGSYGQGGNANYHGGGGGAGWFGGGGGSAAVLCCGGGGGGGGSSYAPSTAKNVVHTAGYQYGHGLVIISNPYMGMPSPKNLTGPDSVCKGDTSQFSADAVAGATGYEWSLPAGVEIISGAGTQSIEVWSGPEAQSGAISIVAKGSCGPSLPRTRNLKILERPVVGFTMPDSAQIWNLVEFEDTTKGASKWWWDFGDGTMDSSAKVAHIYNTLGSFSVRLIVGNGVCFDTLSKTITIYDGSSFSEDARIGMQLQVYPQPAGSMAFLQLADGVVSAPEIHVYTLAGALVVLPVSKEAEFLYSLDVGDLPSGMYLLQVRSNSGNAVKTFLVD